MMMNYDEAVRYIHSLLKFGIKPGLERMRALLERIGNPQDTLRYVHVAGTNGKGSTCSMMSNILTGAGYRTGLFTSPYVVDFCERIQVDNVMISHRELSDEVAFLQPFVEQLAGEGIVLTEFEVITALAFHYFAVKKCDIVVLEVGLGGRLDSTNVIDTPLVSVITSISYDHMNILGDTIEKIAGEKAGVIKRHSSCVSYCLQNPEAQKILNEQCENTKSCMMQPDVGKLIISSSDVFGNCFVYDGQAYRTTMIGVHQIYNALSVIEAALQLVSMGFHISMEHIKTGIERTVVPGRMELLQKEGGLLLFDGGHNEECSQALKKVIETDFSGKDILCVIGMMADKDVRTYASNVIPLCSRVITVMPDHPRAMKAEVLKEIVSEYCSDVSALSIQECTHLLRETFGENTLVLVCGSFYLVSDLRKVIF